MAEQVRLIDDREMHDNHATVEADERVNFSLDGVEYRLDLTTANAELLRKDLAPWIDCVPRDAVSKRPGQGKARASHSHGTRDGRGMSAADAWWETSPDDSPTEKQQKKQFRAAVRQWATEHGYDVGDPRGRLSYDLVADYQQASGNGRRG